MKTVKKATFKRSDGPSSLGVEYRLTKLVGAVILCYTERHTEGVKDKYIRVQDVVEESVLAHFVDRRDIELTIV